MRRHARARLHRYSRTLDVFVACDDERRWATFALGALVLTDSMTFSTLALVS